MEDRDINAMIAALSLRLAGATRCNDAARSRSTSRIPAPIREAHEMTHKNLVLARQELDALRAALAGQAVAP